MKYIYFKGVIFLLFLTLFIVAKTFAQGGGLGAYVDFRQRFYVFDHGVTKMIEQQQVKSFKIGGNCIAYEDYADNFKVYINGHVQTLEIGGIGSYEVTDNLVIYTITDVCKVFDNGKIVTLSASVRDFAIGDSLVMFFDYFYNTLNGYYNGVIYSRKLRLIGEMIQKIEAGDNIAGIVTSEDKNFWIFYNGSLQLITEFVDSVNFKAGRDIVAYMDEPTRTFKAYYQGEIYDVENFEPEMYEMGDARIVYIDNVGNFKTFYDCQIATILPIEPTFFEVKDSMIVFQELDRLKCFYEGKIYEVTPYIPERFEFERDIIVYLDRSRNLQVFRRGETKLIQYGGQNMINDFTLVRDVIILNIGVNKNVIYWKGKFY